MVMPLRMKRMVRERQNLEKPNEDYFVNFENDANLFSFYAYVIGPADTLYEHKFVKLKFDIPERYPLVCIIATKAKILALQPRANSNPQVPPKVTFVQHTGGRLHPNLYVEGKVCLSILGTWPGEKWAWAMTIDTVLITIRSLLDNSPYKHEPNQRDNPNFNQYVQYTGWKSLLLDYVNNEGNPAAKAFLERHISQNGSKMINGLERQASANRGLVQLTSPYGVGRNTMSVNYEILLQDVIGLVEQCQTAEAGRQSLLAPPIVENIDESLPELNDGRKRLKEMGTFQTQGCFLPMARDADSSPRGRSPMEFAENQRKIAPTAFPPLPTDTTPEPSPLKRKHEFIDLA
jgi:ubiquitin-conjugating enzyme E2 Z